MPKPPHVCQCGRVVPHGERCACQVASTRARNKRHDQIRPTAARRGYNHAWRVARLEFLKYHPACARCYAPATVVDHIIAHKGDDALFWDKANWQALCKPCHDRQKQREEQSMG